MQKLGVNKTSTVESWGLFDEHPAWELLPPQQRLPLPQGPAQLSVQISDLETPLAQLLGTAFPPEPVSRPATAVSIPIFTPISPSQLHEAPLETKDPLSILEAEPSTEDLQAFQQALAQTAVFPKAPVSSIEDNLNSKSQPPEPSSQASALAEQATLTKAQQAPFEFHTVLAEDLTFPEVLATPLVLPMVEGPSPISALEPTILAQIGVPHSGLALQTKALNALHLWKRLASPAPNQTWEVFEENLQATPVWSNPPAESRWELFEENLSLNSASIEPSGALMSVPASETFQGKTSELWQTPPFHTIEASEATIPATHQAEQWTTTHDFSQAFLRPESPTQPIALSNEIFRANAETPFYREKVFFNDIQQGKLWELFEEHLPPPFQRLYPFSSLKGEQTCWELFAVLPAGISSETPFFRWEICIDDSQRAQTWDLFEEHLNLPFMRSFATNKSPRLDGTWELFTESPSASFQPASPAPGQELPALVALWDQGRTLFIQQGAALPKTKEPALQFHLNRVVSILEESRDSVTESRFAVVEVLAGEFVAIPLAMIEAVEDLPADSPQSLAHVLYRGQWWTFEPLALTLGKSHKGPLAVWLACRWGKQKIAWGVTQWHGITSATPWKASTRQTLIEHQGTAIPVLEDLN